MKTIHRFFIATFLAGFFAVSGGAAFADAPNLDGHTFLDTVLGRGILDSGGLGIPARRLC